MAAVPALSRDVLFVVELTVPWPRPYGQAGTVSLGNWCLKGLLDVIPFPLKQIFQSASSAICSLSATSQVALAPKSRSSKDHDQ